MYIKELILIFERELTILSDEISKYKNESNIWKTTNSITISAGNLTLHLTRNLSHFISKEIGGFEYSRDREFEFTGENIPREDLIESIDRVKHEVIVSFEGLCKEMLTKDYPIDVFGCKMTHSYFLMHLLGHFNYHLGQINYHRRLLDQT